jgi:hypothetical protein
MDLPTDYLEKFNLAAAENQPRCERDELLDKFLSKLNPPRVADGYPPLTHSRLARLLKASDHAESDWHAFYKLCDGAESFSKLFWYLVKLSTAARKVRPIVRRMFPEGRVNRCDHKTRSTGSSPSA